MTDTPWKQDGWFTSPWNFDPEVTKDWKFPKDIIIHDVTLRDGEQQAGIAYDYDDKIRIAEGLAEIGVQRLEAGMPVVTKELLPNLRNVILALKFILLHVAWWMTLSALLMQVLKVSSWKCRLART